MKPLMVVGILLLVLGIASLFVPIPHNENQGISAGDMHIGVQVRHDEKVSPIISAVLILGGVGLMVAGKRK
ncbi:MAG: hypothetical protein ACJ71N_08220 [Terriglobales bacterium]|jgi:hypothetical protein